MKLSHAVEGFLIARTAEGYSQSTLGIYNWALHLLIDWSQDKDPAKISPTDLQHFFAWLTAEYKPSRSGGDDAPLSPRSIENVWTATRSFYNWATSDLNLSSRPDQNIKRPRYAETQIAPYTEKEIQALLSACTQTASTQGRRKTFKMHRPTALRDAAIILVLLDTGIRASEFSRLKIDDFDPKTGALRVKPFGSGRKTHGRTVYIGKRCQSAVWKYLATRESRSAKDPLFITQENNPFNRGSLSHLVAGLGQRAGVTGAHPHRFRHTFAIQYLRNGGDVFTLQRLLGHTTLDMVRRYLALAAVDDENAHRKASPADNWRI